VTVTELLEQLAEELRRQAHQLDLDADQAGEVGDLERELCCRQMATTVGVVRAAVAATRKAAVEAGE
jgi:hypothetical protein